jgi:hypothetical protein
MKATPQTRPQEFLAALTKLGFLPNAEWDRPGSDDRTLDLKTPQGCPMIRVVTCSEGDDQMHTINIIAFNGRVNQLTQWEAKNLSAQMPSAAILAMIEASL